jgi:cysteinyl-tRNA synthetase
MSKSLGNVVLVHDLLEQQPGEVVRLALLSAHYRQPLDWSGDVLAEARRKLDRLYNALLNVSGWQNTWASTPLAPDFVTALEDDINTPRALAALFSLAREINRLGDSPEAIELARQLRASAEIVGLLEQDPAKWLAYDAAPADIDVQQVDELVASRDAARAERDFAAADRIRDQLLEMGIVIEDSRDGTRWRRTSGDQ